MKLNLGCGRDIRQGYVNIDLHPGLGVDEVADLSKFPWFWNDESVDEILMLDFLEHFPYNQTDKILSEAWRILKMGGELTIQVPDATHLLRAINFSPPFKCNRCGWDFPVGDLRANFFVCGSCGQSWVDIAKAAQARLFGGQDYEGNWHFTTFSGLLLREILRSNGFDKMEYLEKEHQWANWNFKVSVKKTKDVW